MSAVLLALAMLLMQTTRPASVTGIVVRIGTSTPVPRARISLTNTTGPGTPLTATTGADGRFVFPNIQPGQYRVIVTRDGYVQGENGQRSPGRPGTPIAIGAG